MVMKKLLLIPLLVMLASCENSSKNITGNYVLPPELADCSINYLKSTVEYNITVVRCPNSSTVSSSVQNCGKGCTTTRNVTVIDGVEYVRADSTPTATNGVE